MYPLLIYASFIILQIKKYDCKVLNQYPGGADDKKSGKAVVPNCKYNLIEKLPVSMSKHNMNISCH